jgi:hypothetical protein
MIIDIIKIIQKCQTNLQTSSDSPGTFNWGFESNKEILFSVLYYPLLNTGKYMLSIREGDTSQYLYHVDKQSLINTNTSVSEGLASCIKPLLIKRQ